MKNLFVLALCLMSGVMGVRAQQNMTFSVSGSTHLTAKSITIVTNQDYNRADTVDVDADGRFLWQTDCRSGDFFTIAVDDDNSVTVVGDGDRVDLDMQQMSVRGSALNAAFVGFQQSRLADRRAMNALYEEYLTLRDDTSAAAAARHDELARQFHDLDGKDTQRMKQFMQEHSADVLPAFYVSGYYEEMTYDELAVYMDSTSGYYNHPLMQRPRRQFQMLQKRRPGLTYSDLVMSSPEGETMRLSDYVGKSKYVFVDFWASWCGPCRREMPNVASMYDKYHDRGLQIVGVSFDKESDAWQAGIAQLGMTWPQMSDLKGWGSAAHDIYGVTSIPANILIDAEGHIIDVDLHGKHLRLRLAELLGDEEGK